MLKGCVLRYTYRLLDVEWLREEVVEYSEYTVVSYSGIHRQLTEN